MSKGGIIMTHLISVLAAIIVAGTNISYNENEFSLRDGRLVPTGKFHGNAIVRIDDSYTCYGAHNINAELLVGDCNCDNNISIADMVVLNKFCVFGTSISRWGNADMNYDGNVDKYDCESLQSALINKK